MAEDPKASSAPSPSRSHQPHQPRQPHQIRLLVLGLPRTTSSLLRALRILGYTPYTLRNAASNPRHMQLWHALASTTKPSTQETTSTPTSTSTPLPPAITSLFTTSPYDTIADLPACIFAPQLIATYPSAKVILPTRSYEAWEKDMRQSIGMLFTWRLFRACRVTGLSSLAPLARMLRAVFAVHGGGEAGVGVGMDVYGRRAFEAHNARVREMVPAERLLEVDVEGGGEQVGWEELCGFLGVERPAEGTGFPRFVGEDAAMRRGFERTWWQMVRYLVVMVLLPGFVGVVGVVGWVYADEVRAVRDGYVLAPLKAYLDG